MPQEVLNDIVDQLLTARGYTTPEAKQAFLHPQYEEGLHSPSLLVDMGRAVERIVRAMQHNERIAIYADFDCDGIPAAVVMHDFFTSIGYTNITVYIPHRDSEGFGVHTQALDILLADGVSLIITVDVGSSAIDAVAYAQSKGMDVIITDHHEFTKDREGNDILPPAYAVVNPKRAGYPFRDLCGSGVAFKLVCALIEEGRTNKDSAHVSTINRIRTYAAGQEKWLLDMVGIATLADMVPLVGENRVLAKYGLIVVQKSRRPGLQALCRIAKIDQQHITEETIGYTIAPRINAASRMGDARLAFTLFSTKDPAVATACAAQLETLNNERKSLVGAIAKQAHVKITQRYPNAPLPPVVVLGDPSWRPAVLGSVAATLAEKYCRPFFLWGREGTGLLKGSCRTYGGVDVLAVMTHASHILLHHGGHKAAGGFAVSDINAHALQEEFEKAHTVIVAAKVQAPVPREMTPEKPIDIVVEHVSVETVRGLRKMAPFGVGNPEPVFRLCGVVTAVAQFGKEKNHFECTVASQHNPKKTLRCMAFFSTPASFTYTPQVGDMVCVTGTITESRFAGRVRAEVRVEDIEKA